MPSSFCFAHTRRCGRLYLLVFEIPVARNLVPTSSLLRCLRSSTLDSSHFDSFFCADLSPYFGLPSWVFGLRGSALPDAFRCSLLLLSWFRLRRLSSACGLAHCLRSCNLCCRAGRGAVPVDRGQFFRVSECWRFPIHAMASLPCFASSLSLLRFHFRAFVVFLCVPTAVIVGPLRCSSCGLRALPA